MKPEAQRFRIADVPNPTYDTCVDPEKNTPWYVIQRIANIALVGGILLIGYVHLTRNQREEVNNREHMQRPIATSLLDDNDCISPNDNMCQTESLSPDPEAIIPPSSDSPHIILKVGPEDLSPEKLLTLVHEALEKLMESDSIPLEKIRIEILPDEGVSTEEVQKLMREALQPLMQGPTA